jgi:NAD(P)-dependent dehydrogenase (short-subunit alcohol dehydrogenase family)
MAGRFSLQGKTVLVTGAARGIGADAARRLAAPGARVSCVGFEPERLEQLARECGNGAVWFEADVTELDSLERVVAGTVESGGLDAVVANAGIATMGAVRTMPAEPFERVIEVNLLGTYRTVRACLPHLIESRGYVLCVASLAALLPYFPGMAPYSASKAGVEAFCSALQMEVAHLGVDVGVAYFPWIGTDMVNGADAEHPAFKLLRSRLRWPVSKTYGVDVAGKAVVRGIERRSRVVRAPGWLTAVAALRGIVGPGVARDMAKNAPEAMALLEAEYQRSGGQAGRPVGAGGAADESRGRG